MARCCSGEAAQPLWVGRRPGPPGDKRTLLLTPTSVHLGRAHVSNECLPHAGTESSGLRVIRVPAFRFEQGVGELVIGQDAKLGKELVNVQWLAIRNGTTEPEADADFFQQLVVGGSHRSTVAEPGLSAMGRERP